MGVRLQASKTGHGNASGIPPAATSEPSGAFRQEEDTDAERQGEGHTQSNNKPPRSSRPLDIADAVVDQVGNQDTQSNQQLIRSDDGATDLARAAFGLVHGHADGKVADTQTSDEASHHDVYPGAHGGDLNDAADDEHDDAKGQALAATPPIGGVGAAQRTDEGPYAHERDDERKDDVVEGLVSWRALAKSVDEVLENLNAGNLTLTRGQQRPRDAKHQDIAQTYGVIAKQETPDGGCDTQKDGFEPAVGAINAYCTGRISISKSSDHIGRRESVQLTLCLAPCLRCCRGAIESDGEEVGRPRRGGGRAHISRPATHMASVGQSMPRNSERHSNGTVSLGQGLVCCSGRIG